MIKIILKSKLKESRKSLFKENFWKDKKLAKKTVKQKKIFEEIINSYQKSLNEINNLKDLYNLAFQEKNDEIIKDCNKKIDQIYK